MMLYKNTKAMVRSCRADADFVDIFTGIFNTLNNMVSLPR